MFYGTRLLRQLRPSVLASNMCGPICVAYFNVYLIGWNSAHECTWLLTLGVPLYAPSIAPFVSVDQTFDHQRNPPPSGLACGFPLPPLLHCAWQPVSDQSHSQVSQTAVGSLACVISPCWIVRKPFHSLTWPSCSRRSTVVMESLHRI